MAALDLALQIGREPLLAAELPPAKPIAAAAGTGAPSPDLVAGCLKEFLEIAVKMAQVDEAVQEAAAHAPPPEAPEAQKWHEVSLKALQWTRSSLASQQDGSLAQLKQAVLSRRVPDALADASAVAPAVAPALPAARTSTVPPSAGEPLAVMRPQAARGQQVPKNVGSLREDLERLREFPTEQCLIVRRIKRLGLGSPELLRKALAPYGEVAEVLVAHSFERKSAKCRVDRVRPAALGFVVMGSAEEAAAVLRAGPSIMVGDVDISVSIFEPFECKPGED